MSRYPAVGASEQPAARDKNNDMVLYHDPDRAAIVFAVCGTVFLRMIKSPKPVRPGLRGFCRQAERLSVFFKEELLGQSHTEVLCEAAELVGRDGLTLGRGHGADLDQDLGALFDRVHQPEGQIEVLA